VLEVTWLLVQICKEIFWVSKSGDLRSILLEDTASGDSIS